ncbi:Elongation of very long chain fatty acids protein [Gryllus bimaculatus]|nr:Elongation of very long chain fatty acids protein [Gryllus bimaculatus]
MASLMHLVVDNYNELLENTKDPQVDSWLFMSSPIPVLGILAFYLYFVLKLGPAIMKDRKPLNLQGVLVAYNAYQVIFSAWLCTMPFRAGAVQFLFTHGCQPPKQRNPFADEVSAGAWWYFFSKIIELLDTVFFVLRKKQNQVTFLHVYHHTITALFSWGYLKFLPDPVLPYADIFGGVVGDGLPVPESTYLLLCGQCDDLPVSVLRLLQKSIQEENHVILWL